MLTTAERALAPGVDRFKWRSDGHPGGHANYCTEPHNMLEPCPASADDPPTLLGGRSRAWFADHPAVAETGEQRS